MESFTLNLQRRLEPGSVTSGKFDGTHACLAATTSAGNVLVHSPHREPPENADFKILQEHRLAWTGETAELQIGRQVGAKVTNIYFLGISHVFLSKCFISDIFFLLFNQIWVTRKFSFK